MGIAPPPVPIVTTNLGPNTVLEPQFIQPTVVPSPFPLEYQPWMYPATIALMIFDVFSFVLAIWMYIEGSDEVLSRIFRRCCPLPTRREQEARMRRMALARWQREQWARMDAAEAEQDEEDEVAVEWTMTAEQQLALQRHHAVQMEMRWYDFA